MNKKTTNMNKVSIITLLIIAIVYIGVRAHNYYNPNQFDIIVQEMSDEMDVYWDTVTTKETKDWTGTTQGERTFEEMLSIEPDYMYYDTNGSQREEDSINAYMRHWYEVLDTNSDGDIDGDYNMDCGGEVLHDSIIEWLEE
jgi:hypothetical protein